MAASWLVAALLAAAAAAGGLGPAGAAHLRAAEAEERAMEAEEAVAPLDDEMMMDSQRGPPMVASRFDEVFAWRHMDYALPREERERLLAAGERAGFVPRRCVPMGFDRWGDRLFVTTPRRKPGVPVALSYIRVDDKERSPKLIPYPDYESNQLPAKGVGRRDASEPLRIASAYRIRVDECDRLWVADTGRADAGDGDGHGIYSTPQILVFDLTEDKLIRRFFLRAEHFSNNSFFATVTVDVPKRDCADAFAYVADLGQPGLLVYSFKSDDAWRVGNAYFLPDPLATNFDVDGLQYQSLDGVITATPGGLRDDGYRNLYFHPFSSTSEFSVSTSILRNRELTTAPKAHLQFTHLGSRGAKSQSPASFFHDKTGVLFFTEVMTHAVTCWNPRANPRIRTGMDVVAADTVTRGFIYPGDIKVDRDDNLWVLATNFPRYSFGELDPKMFNHFFYKTAVKTAIRGTKCDVKMSGGGGYHHHHDPHRHHQHRFPATCCGPIDFEE